MKKNILPIIFTFLFFAFTYQDARCQNSGSFSEKNSKDSGGNGNYKNVLKTNFLPIFWGQVPFTGEFRLVYERVLADHHALQGSLAYVGPSMLINLSKLSNDSLGKSSVGINGVHGTLTYKYYFDADAPNGFYVGPQFSYNYTKFDNKTKPGDFLTAKYFYGVGMIGYQIVEGHFAFDIFTGAGFKSNQWKANSFTSDFKEQVSATGFKMVLGFNIGAAF